MWESVVARTLTRWSPKQKEVPVVLPKVVERSSNRNLIWIFSKNGHPDCPDWLDGYHYPITIDDADALVGMNVKVFFEYKWQEDKFGNKFDYQPVRTTITDYNSNLMVHDVTFDLAAVAFLTAAKHMRLEGRNL